MGGWRESERTVRKLAMTTSTGVVGVPQQRRGGQCWWRMGMSEPNRERGKHIPTTTVRALIRRLCMVGGWKGREEAREKKYGISHGGGGG